MMTTFVGDYSSLRSTSIQQARDNNLVDMAKTESPQVSLSLSLSLTLFFISILNWRIVKVQLQALVCAWANLETYHVLRC